MKKLTALLLISLLLACGCAQGTSAPAIATPLATPSPTPTPAPEGWAATGLGSAPSLAFVDLGKDDQAAALFLAGAQAEAAAFGLELAQADSTDEDYDAYIVFAPEGASGLPENCAVYSPEQLTGVSLIRYNNAEQTALSLQAALEYPPHDTPVRMLALFESEESEAAQQYAALDDEGKVFRKGTYYVEASAPEESEETEADEKPSAQPPEEWVAKKLEKFIEGTLDCIYAETPALAAAALEALSAAGRNDLLEIFTAGATLGSVQAMVLAKNGIYAGTVCVNSAYAGQLAVRAALSYLADGETTEMTLEPLTLYYTDLSAEDPAGSLMALGDQGALLTDWMRELQAWSAAQNA